MNTNHLHYRDLFMRLLPRLFLLSSVVVTLGACTEGTYQTQTTTTASEWGNPTPMVDANAPRQPMQPTVRAGVDSFTPIPAHSRDQSAFVPNGAGSVASQAPSRPANTPPPFMQMQPTIPAQMPGSQ